MNVQQSNESVLHWHKSSHSGSTGDCVEVASNNAPASLLVRDSKDPNGGMLRFSPVAWQAFVAGVRAGDFQSPRA